MDKVLVLPVKNPTADGHLIALDDRDDDALRLMARAGVQRAFEILVKRHQRMVLGTAFKYLGNRLLAEDIAQNSFMDLLGCLGSYRPEGKLRSFLAKIVINNCRMANRHDRSEAGMRQGLCSLGDGTGQVVDDEDALQRREEQRFLDAALLTLSPKLREVLVLRFAAGLSQQQIGESLGIRIGTVKSRLFAGMEKLCQALEEIRR